MSRFPYKPLGPDAIRLVAFDDQEKTSPTIHLKLLHILRPSTTNSNWPPYHALSWTWGQGKRDRRVLLDGLPFYITENLHGALHHLRADASFSSASSFLLWIDLICINQLDDDEKSVQVVRMRETYKDACKVIVWLGDDPERRKATGEVASFLSEHIPPIPDGAMYAAQEPTYLLEPQNAAVLRTLCRDILRRPWWWRMWVIQEVALA
ncbi:HET-domain-containing protein, partial [Parathielavia hyrcaniae]